MDDYLLDRLTEYTASDAYPLHMPGHKRQISHFEHPFAIDITEIEGFDNLHHAEGILLHAQERAARLYGADETWYLVNGSTCGILAAVSASVPRGGRILMARNCHKAAYHAVFLNGLQVTWLYPQMDVRTGICGSISPEQVREALAGPYTDRAPDDGDCGSEGKPGKGSCGDRGILAVLIPSPTYDGVVSDIRAIAEEAHRAGAILIVDEAHGAHFAMHSYFPESALACGADIVINSLHKTMPSLTQTALLHVKGVRADRKRIQKYLDIYQSSSPSYVLMAGMDECVRMMQTQGRELFEQFVDRLETLRLHLRRMKVLHLVTGEEPGIHAFAFDPSKIVIAVPKEAMADEAFQNRYCLEADDFSLSGYEDFGRSKSRCKDSEILLSGPMIAGILRKHYHLEPEMAAEHSITAIMTVADTQEGFDRLECALLEIDAGLKKKQREGDADGAAENLFAMKSLAVPEQARPALPEAVMTMEEADRLPYEPVLPEECAGRITAEFLYLYPPGIPLLVPGERIPEGFPEWLRNIRKVGLNIQGLSDYSIARIQCVVEEECE